VKDYRIGLDDIRHARRDKELQKYARKNKKKPVIPAVITDQTGEARGIVGAVHFGACIVHTRGERRTCRPLPGVAVGDEVEVTGDRIAGIAPRTTTLSRPDPANPHVERVIAANIDTVVVVTSVGTPPFRPGLIDRMLVAAQRGGAHTLICVNKIELRTDQDDLSALDVHRVLGVRVIATSCSTGEGIDELRAAIRARTCVFAGHSGVGKSSLMNALFPELAYATAEAGKKGRHTTTSSCLHEDADGTRIIDTPGIREFGLWRIGPQELRHYFPEFAEFATRCRFRDCTHAHEPDCAVIGAALPRYPQYLRLLGSLAS
jgi:ribosome biogenesis GTPase / thiamine phosphate phosphatase